MKSFKTPEFDLEDCRTIDDVAKISARSIEIGLNDFLKDNPGAIIAISIAFHKIGTRGIGFFNLQLS